MGLAVQWLAAGYIGKDTCKKYDGEGPRETISGFPQHIITCNPPFSLSSLCLKCCFVGVGGSQDQYIKVPPHD